MEKDSDGDGFTNGDEYDADPMTNPGDAGSYPGANHTGNSTSNITSSTLDDTSARIGPVDMRDVVSTIYAIAIPLFVVIFIALIAVEGVFIVRQRLKGKKNVSLEERERDL
jgi:hypothetical protein